MEMKDIELNKQKFIEIAKENSKNYMKTNDEE